MIKTLKQDKYRMFSHDLIPEAVTNSHEAFTKLSLHIKEQYNNVSYWDLIN